MNDIVLNKTASLERCINRIKEEYGVSGSNFMNNITKQDSVILNLARACQISIDLGLVIVKEKKLGLPTHSRDIFEILANEGIIPETLGSNLKKMVGFRNLAVHEYQSLNLDVVSSIIENFLDDFEAFRSIALKLGS